MDDRVWRRGCIALGGLCAALTLAIAVSIALPLSITIALSLPVALPLSIALPLIIRQPSGWHRKRHTPRGTPLMKSEFRNQVRLELGKGVRILMVGHAIGFLR